MMNQERITAEDFKYILRKGTSTVTGQRYLSMDGKELHIENLSISGEVVLESAEQACHSIHLRSVTFECLRCQHGHVRFISFEECTFGTLVIVTDCLPRSLSGGRIQNLRLESYRGAAAAPRDWPADHIVLVNTTVGAGLAEALSPRRSLLFEQCALENVTLHRGTGDGRMLFQKLHISDCSVTGQLLVTGWSIEWVQISGLALPRTTSLVFTFCVIGHLRLYHINAGEALLTFNNVSFSKAMSDVANSNSVVKENTSVVMSESQLAEIRWAFCDWSRTPMWIGDIVIGKVKLQGSTTPRRIVPTGGQWKEVTDLFGLFESYARSQGHTADAITNKAGALKAYRIYLGSQHRDSLDRITLWLSEWISVYGSNWLKALSVLLGSGFGLFLLVLLASDSRVSWCRIDASTPMLTLEYAGYFLEFLSPFHSSTFLGPELNPLGKLVDALARIWMGFVIYHVVRSTRKFVS